MNIKTNLILVLIILTSCTGTLGSPGEDPAYQNPSDAGWTFLADMDTLDYGYWNPPEPDINVARDTNIIPPDITIWDISQDLPPDIYSPYMDMRTHWDLETEFSNCCGERFLSSGITRYPPPFGDFHLQVWHISDSRLSEGETIELLGSSYNNGRKIVNTITVQPSFDYVTTIPLLVEDDYDWIDIIRCDTVSMCY